MRRHSRYLRNSLNEESDAKLKAAQAPLDFMVYIYEHPAQKGAPFKGFADSYDTRTRLARRGEINLGHNAFLASAFLKGYELNR